MTTWSATIASHSTKAGINMHIPTVKNMVSTRGNKIANQFILAGQGVSIFQSYESIIAIRRWTYKPYGHYQVTLDKNYWDYSVTTGKYRNQFLGESKAATLKKIKSGEYKLADLNK